MIDDGCNGGNERGNTNDDEAIKTAQIGTSKLKLNS